MYLMILILGIEVYLFLQRKNRTYAGMENEGGWKMSGADDL
jgi:hypothetical protein